MVELEDLVVVELDDPDGLSFTGPGPRAQYLLDVDVADLIAPTVRLLCPLQELLAPALARAVDNPRLRLAQRAPDVGVVRLHTHTHDPDNFSFADERGVAMALFLDERHA